MKTSLSDKICIGSAIAITLTGIAIKKQADRNYAAANSIAKNVRASTMRLNQIHSEVQGANKALVVGNNMMRRILTKEVG